MLQRAEVVGWFAPRSAQPGPSMLRMTLPRHPSRARVPSCLLPQPTALAAVRLLAFGFQLGPGLRRLSLGGP